MPTDIKSIFLAAADKPPGERAAFLSEACGGDAELRRRLEALLKAHDATGGWLGEGATPTSDFPGFTAPGINELAPHFPQLEILELLGQGGMGAVYKARQKNLDRLVALKILPHDAGDKGFAERFTREARTLAKLNHPGIVAVHDFGTTGGWHWFVMEYVDGVNLRQAKRAGALTSTAALTVIPKICEALQFAHDAGVVHRDIKPENVLLDSKGRIKIADFGIAKLIDPSRSHLTGTHQAMGTPHYMAPEQWERPLEVDHRADIYSLGVVFYELLTGELPLGRFPPPSKKVQVDVRLDEVVLRTLEKEPERRYQQASEVKTDVERISTDSTAVVENPPESPVETESSNESANFSLPGVINVAILAFIIASTVAVYTSPEIGALVCAVLYWTGLLIWRWLAKGKVKPDVKRMTPASAGFSSQRIAARKTESPPVSFSRHVVVPTVAVDLVAVLVFLGVYFLHPGPPVNRADDIAAVVVLSAYATAIVFCLLTLRWWSQRRGQDVTSTVAESVRLLRLNSPPTWVVLVCALGVLNAIAWPWLSHPTDLYGVWNPPPGFADWAYVGGLFVANALFGVLGLLVIATGSVEKLRIVRIVATILIGALILTLAICFVVEGEIEAHDVRKLDPRISVNVGPYAAAVLAGLLLVIGVLDFRGWLVRRGLSPPAADRQDNSQKSESSNLGVLLSFGAMIAILVAATVIVQFLGGR